MTTFSSDYYSSGLKQLAVCVVYVVVFCVDEGNASVGNGAALQTLGV